MKLYSYAGAPSPQRVELMLKYKGVSLDTETVDIRAAKQFDKAFRDINPRCTVPALITDDGSCLSEVIAICLYLDSQYPEKPLFGSSDLERAKVVNWMHMIFTDGFMAVAEVLRNSSPAMKDRALTGPENMAQIPELAERGRRRLPIFMRLLDDALKHRPFLIGEQISQADIDAYVVVNFAGWVKFSVPDDCTALRDWHARMEKILA